MHQSIARNMSVTPQKIPHRSTSSLHVSPLASCINLPLAQPNVKAPLGPHPKETENQINYPVVVINQKEKEKPQKMSQIIEKNPENHSSNFKSNSSLNSLEGSHKQESNPNVFSSKERGRPISFDLNVMKEMQAKFKQLLEENEKLKCAIIQKNKLEAENLLTQQITCSQISELELQINEYKHENASLQNQLENFRHQNESNIKMLEEMEEKMMNYVKAIENGKSATKNLTLENIGLKKAIEDQNLKINNFQSKVKQDASQLRSFEETIAKMNKEHDTLINSWNARYADLQQNFVLEKNLHQQSEKNLKAKIQNLEEELSSLGQKYNESNENILGLHSEFNNEREKNQILEFKLQEIKNELSSFNELESKAHVLRQDNDKLMELVALLKKDRDMFEKELFLRQSESKSLGAELEEARKENEDLKGEVEFLKERQAEAEKMQTSYKNEILTQKEEIHELIALNEVWENKINLILSENEQLSCVIKEKDQALSSLHEQLKQLESKSCSLQKAFASCENELKLSQACTADRLKAQEETESRLRETQKAKDQLEADKKAIIHFYEDNRVRLDKEIEGLRSRNAGLRKELEDCKLRFEEFKALKFDEKNLELKFAAERSAFETEIFQLKNKILEYEIAYNALLKKTEDLHTRNSENHNERESLQKETSEKIEGLERSNKELGCCVERLKASLFEKEELVIKLENAKRKCEGQIKELKEIVQINKEELEQIYSIGNQKYSNYEVMQQDVEKAQQENEALGKENKELKKLVNKLREEENNYKRTIEILTNTSKDYKVQIDQFSGELNAKNKQLIEKIESLDKQKENYSKCMEKIQALEIKLLNKLQLK